MTTVTVIAADYRAEDELSLLARLDELSAQRKDGGMLHGDHIHYIQGKLSEEDGFPFLKAAISMILDRVPGVFPANLPELVQDEAFEVPETWSQAFREINEHLIIPISGHDLVRVILAAREYEKGITSQQPASSPLTITPSVV